MIPFYFSILLSDPILIDGGVSANWVFIALAAIVSFFMTRTMIKMETSIKVLNLQVGEIKFHQGLLRKDFDHITSDKYIAGQNEILSNQIIAKIKAITPP